MVGKALGEPVLQGSISVSPPTSPCTLPSCACYWHQPPMQISDIPANFMTKACVLHLLFFIKPPTNTFLVYTNEKWLWIQLLGQLCACFLPFLLNPLFPNLGITDPRGLWNGHRGSLNSHVHCLYSLYSHVFIVCRPSIMCYQIHNICIVFSSVHELYCTLYKKFIRQRSTFCQSINSENVTIVTGRNFQNLTLKGPRLCPQDQEIFI